MKAQIVTTITTYVDIETLKPSHEVDIACADPLPRQVVMAAVEGGLRATLVQIGRETADDEDAES